MASQEGPPHSPTKQIPSDTLNEIKDNQEESFISSADHINDESRQQQVQVVDDEVASAADQSAVAVVEQQPVENSEISNSFPDFSENLTESVAVGAREDESLIPSSPLSNTQAANSSPLTSVEDLNEDSRDTFSESKRKDSEDEEANDYDIDNQTNSIANSPSLNSRPVSYIKKSSNANSDDGYGASASSRIADEQQSITSTFKKNPGSDGSGATPFDAEEGVRLPGRKKPVPPSQINSKDRAGRTFIFKYASNGDYTITEALLKAGASLRLVDNAGWTPLHEACLNGHERIVELLLSYDADVDAPGGDGDTPLHDAIGNGHFGVVTLLLKHGASLDLHNEHHQTPEEFAIEKLESLQEEGDESYETDQETAKKIVDLLKEWRKMTEKVVKRNQDGQTMFHLACTAGDTQQVQKMLDYGADINAADNSGWAPIHNAALHGRDQVLQLLLRYGSEVDPLGFSDETPLHDAAANGHSACVSLLLQYGAEPFRKNRDGRMPLDLVPKGRDDLLDLLNMPLDHWQPVKSAEYYPRLLESATLKKGAKNNSETSSGIVKTVKREIPQHWEGLEARGSFESSREEKKFQAILKSLNDTDSTKSVVASTTIASVEKGKGPVRQPQSSLESSKSATTVEKFDSLILKAESKKKRQMSNEPPSKRPKLNSSTTSSVKEKYVASTGDVTNSTVQSTSKKELHPLNRNSNSKTSNSSPGAADASLSVSVSRKSNAEISAASRTDKSATASLPRTDVSKKPPKPRPAEKIAVPSAIHRAYADLDGTAVKVKKKSVFSRLGYQGAGESTSTEVSSESVVQQHDGSAIASAATPLSTTAKLPGSSVIESIPSNISSEPPKSAEATHHQTPQLSAGKPGLAPSSSILLGDVDGAKSSKPTVATDLHKKDLSKKAQLEKNYCLPLCAYVKQQTGSLFFKPTNISREGLWGSLPKLEHTKVFVDMQLAFCLGLKDGRELREKYPFLDSRVASTVEKAALEGTVLSHRVLTKMLLTISPEWITTITVNGKQSFKISDVDIHLVFWSESLFRLLSDHVVKVESSQSQCPHLHWLEDLDWPAPINAEPVEIPKIYVHKLKRMRFQ